MPIETPEKHSHESGLNVQVSIGPSISRCSVTGVQFAGRYEITCARCRITKLTPTIKCASASVIEADSVEVMHVWGERVLYPPGTHDFETVKPETTRILSELPCLPFS
jgi:hypothetical protein